MTMTTCRQCGHGVSTEAPVCPNCGVKLPGAKKHRAAGNAGKAIVWITVFIGGCTYVALETPLFFGTKEEQDAKNLADKRRDCTDERSFSRASVGADVEANAMICPKGVQSDQLAELVGAVRSSGHSCTSIQYASLITAAQGKFDLWCNHASYRYTLRDKGGQWEVSVE